MALREKLEEVRSYIAAVQANSANEQEAKDWFITPILQALEWRGPSRVRLEQPAGRERVKMDFALLGPDGKSVALIEAKMPGADLSAHVGQMLNYAFYEGVDICALTTGVEWWFYLPREKGDPSTRRFAELNVRDDDTDDLVSTFESCLGYDAMIDGSARERAKQMLDDRRNEERLLVELPKAWRRLLETPGDLLIELVQEEVQQELGLTPSRRQVETFLRDSQSQPPPPRSPLPAPPIAPPSRPPRRSNPAARPVGYILQGERYPARTWLDIWLGVAEIVYTRHSADFDRALQLRGSTRQYIARSEEELYAARRIGRSPYFAEVNFGAGDCIRRSRDLLELFGYRANDLEVIEE